jgi:hypothetical protein
MRKVRLMQTGFFYAKNKSFENLKMDNVFSNHYHFFS